MKCFICGIKKLSKEFPPEPLTDKCDHVSKACMRCVIKCVHSKPECPDVNCAAQVTPDSPAIKDIELRLAYLFPSYKVEFSAPEPSGDSEANIRISTLTGESIFVAFNPHMTVMQLKQVIRQKQGHEESKQRLLFNGKDVDVQRKNGTLAQLKDYGIQAHQTLHLVVLLFAIPDQFNHVIFDLFWGYPANGCDYLDASCLVFSGSKLLSIVDYNKTVYLSIWHSGDVMDHANKIGHHTINVKLKEISQDITHLFFTLSAWNSPNISRFPNPSLKFFESSDKHKDLCKTSFNHARHSQAVVMCFVSRRGGVWQIYNSGKLSAGNAKSYKRLVSTVQSIIQEGV